MKKWVVPGLYFTLKCKAVVLTLAQWFWFLLRWSNLQTKRRNLSEECPISQQLYPKTNQIQIPIHHVQFLFSWSFQDQHNQFQIHLCCSFQTDFQIQWGISFLCLRFLQWWWQKNIGISSSTSSVTSCHGHFVVSHWKVCFSILTTLDKCVTGVTRKNPSRVIEGENCITCRNFSFNEFIFFIICKPMSTQEICFFLQILQWSLCQETILLQFHCYHGLRKEINSMSEPSWILSILSF